MGILILKKYAEPEVALLAAATDKQSKESDEEWEVCVMTAIRKEAIELLERVPEDKLSFVIQIMRGVNGLLGDTDTNARRVVNLDQFVMPATERGQNADSYIRELRDNDRI